jgi:hypothetical protein
VFWNSRALVKAYHQRSIIVYSHFSSSVSTLPCNNSTQLRFIKAKGNQESQALILIPDLHHHHTFLSLQQLREDPQGYHRFQVAR